MGLGKKSKFSLDPSKRSPESMELSERQAAAIVETGRGISRKNESNFQKTSANTFKLTPGESAAALKRKEEAENWRSRLLHFEADLRELASGGVNVPASSSRIMKVFALYDGVTSTVDAQSDYLAEFLRLFRIEFCRAIFSNQSIGLTETESNVFSTFFDQVKSLMRENAYLRSEVALGNTKQRVEELTDEVKQLTDTINVYKTEIDRLTRQKDQALEKCRKSSETIELLEENLENLKTKTDKEMQALNVENKDMQLQVFRLKKQISGGRAKLLQDAYRQLKLSKLSMMNTLFSEGDERIALLVFMSQLENRLNEALDIYDTEFILSGEMSDVEIRRKMGVNVACILEEIHLCEQNYRRLVPNSAGNLSSEETDETDCFVALLFDPKIYERLINREELKRRLEITLSSPLTIREPNGEPKESFDVEGSETKEKQKFSDILNSSASDDLNGTKKGIGEKKVETSASPLKEEEMLLEDLVFKKKREWIESIFSHKTNQIVMTKYGLKVTVEKQAEGRIPADLLMPRLLRHPLKDISSSKFLGGVEVYAGTNPIQHRFLCAINNIDPNFSIQLPDMTNFIKLKYKNSLKMEPLQSSTTESMPQRLSLDKSNNFSPVKDEGRRSTITGGLKNAKQAINDWGGKTLFKEERVEKNNEVSEDVFEGNENLKVFKELKNITAAHSNSSGQATGGALSSTTGATVAFQRLNPLAPNRPPEWIVYKTLFGGYRSFTPRMIEVSTLDHIMLSSCERHFTRMEYRFERCLNEANRQATSNQMSLLMAERFFRESYELTDFQEALIDELEYRYVFPELVAKNLYELLCYLDAMAGKDKLLSLYLDVVRGFQPPTHIHYICFLLYHLNYSWPTSDATEQVSNQDALSVLRFLYRNTDSIASINVNNILVDFDRATRSPITLGEIRSFLATSLQHQEEPLLLFLNGIFSKTVSMSQYSETTFESYAMVITSNWDGSFNEKRNLIRFLNAGLGFNKGPLLSNKDLALVAASTWCSKLWS